MDMRASFTAPDTYLVGGNDGIGRRRGISTRTLVVVGLLAAAVGIGVGVLIGYFSRDVPDAVEPQEGPCLGPDVPDKIIEDGESDVTERLFQGIKAENIKELLRDFTAYPHLGGTDGEDQLGEELAALWRGQGLDLVTERTYEVLLSYPDRDDPSQTFLLDGDGHVLFESQKEEAILRPEQNHSDVIPPFNAYSPPANFTAQLVYANYGRREDFKFLQEQGISLNGSIVICRYGRIFRGDKVKFAQQNGAAGVLLYTDPKDYSLNTTEGVYPDSWWLPPTGVQRGTVFADDGDPLTPGYPSIDTAYRLNETEANLPTIPALPISYGDAEELLRHMDGDDPPEEWKGDLDVPYRLGPGFVNDTWEVRLKVTTHNVMVNTTNVFGYIYGSVEPDRYVLLGNHRDAWVFGALDPTSGTASMVELSRVMADLVNNGNWRPRRTIVFCSWGAEEYALVGSQEWVEEFRTNLGERAVAYLNVDMSVQGNFSMRALGVPLLYSALYDVAKKIDTPNQPGKTMYDEWKEAFPKPGDNEDLPNIGNLGAGSDYASFLIMAGIPCLDVRYTYNRNELPILDYPLYHSVYETLHLYENFIDRNFQFNQVITQFWGELARLLADSLILPLDVTSYADVLEENVEDLDEGYGDLMRSQNISVDDLRTAVSMFRTATEDFKTRLANVNRRNPAQTRLFNDQLMKLERAFLDAAGLPDRPLYKHLVFAPSAEDAYAGATFPGLVDLMFEIEADPDPAQRWERIKHHFSVIIFTIQSAASTLTDARSV